MDCLLHKYIHIFLNYSNLLHIFPNHFSKSEHGIFNTYSIFFNYAVKCPLHSLVNLFSHFALYFYL